MAQTIGERQSYHFDRIQQPTWSHTESGSVGAEAILEGVFYKLTRVGFVVRRGIAVFKDRCKTYHDPDNLTNATTWMLDRNCALLPANPTDLAPKKRGVRPKGTWAITAAVQGVDTFVELFEVTVDWPPSWAAAGYTSLVLGFPDRSEAERWHRALAGVLADLAAVKGHHVRHKSNVDLACASLPMSPYKDTAQAAVDFNGSQYSSSSHALVTSQDPSGAAATPPTAVSKAVSVVADSAAGPELEDATDGGSSSDEEEEECEPGSSASAREERWVPYRQTNGVAIYYHAVDGKKSGGEYMVSCVIRGRPSRVAAALMRLRGNTTILGPAAHVELLQPGTAAGAAGPNTAATVAAAGEEGGRQRSGGSGKEVLRLVLTASGQAGFFCAPREVILERMRKDEEDGVIVIMFKSVDLANEASAANGKGSLFGSGLFRRPVRGVVAGGYTIAGLRGEGASSSESLVTCIVKVDLGGCCAASSWCRPLATAAGWTDSFLERILMSVHLLRDEVEQRRFQVQPFKLVASAKARFNEDGAVVGDAAAARAHVNSLSIGGSMSIGGAMPTPSFTEPSTRGARIQPILTHSRPLARMASHRLSTYGGPAPLPPAASIAEDHPSTSDAMDVASFRLDVPYIQSLATMPRKYWKEIHVPGTDAPFSVRGPTYLKDRKKLLAGAPAFSLGAMELVALPPPGTQLAGGQTVTTGVVEHVARFVPSIRQGGAPFSIIINLVVPGSPMLSLLAVFCCDKHPNILGTPPARPMDEPHDWQPFDFVLHKFVYGSDETRNRMLKLIPHIASGSWMIKQSVGTTPAILGKALKTTYHCTPTYIEVDVDISANSVANYVTGMVRGATSSLDIDLAFVLEGTAPWELPECLLGALRLTRLDCKAAATSMDWSRELPLATVPR